MIDALYADDDLVDLYDRLSVNDADARFYLGKIGAPPKTVIDLGSGTGTFAIRLANSGYDVIGIEPAPAMMARAEHRDKAGLVRWIQGDANAMPAGQAADVVVMMGHAFQCLLSDDEVQVMLQKARCALRPGGCLLFESRNPLAMAWKRWNPTQSAVRIRDRRGQAVTLFHEVTSIEAERVTFVTTYRWPDRQLRSQSTLGFPGLPAIVAHLRAASFENTTIFGNWDGSPFTDRSPEIIILAQ